MPAKFQFVYFSFFFLIIFLFVGCSTTNKNLKLIQAAEKGNLAQIKKLVAEGADVNALNPSGYTAYTLASVNGQIKAMQYLKSKGAKIVLPESDFESRLPR